MKKYLLEFKSCVFYMYWWNSKRKTWLYFSNVRIFNDFLCCKEIKQTKFPFLKLYSIEEGCILLYYSKSSWAKQLRGKEFNKFLPPKQKRRPLPFLLSLSFFYAVQYWRYFMMEYSTKLHKILYLLYYFNILHIPAMEISHAAAHNSISPWAKCTHWTLHALYPCHVRTCRSTMLGILFIFILINQFQVNT